MIVDEWKRRKYTKEDITDLSNDWTLSHLKNDNTVFVGKRGNTFIQLDRTDEHHIFLTRRDYYKTKKGFTNSNTKEWYIPGQEYHGWESIWEHEDWSTWMKGSRVDDFLPFPELDRIIEEKRKISFETAEHRISNFIRNEKFEVKNKYPIAIEITVGKSIEFWYFFEVYSIDDLTYSSKLMRVDYQWSKIKGVYSASQSDYHSYSSEYYRNVKSRVTRSWDPRENKSFVYEIHYDSIKKAEAFYIMLQEHNKIIRNKNQFSSGATSKMIEVINAAREKVAYDSYLANYGDPLNWKHSIEKSKVEEVHWRDVNISDKLGEIVKRDFLSADDFYGRTLNEVELLVNSDKVPEKYRFELTNIPIEIDKNTYVFVQKPEDKNEN